MVGNISIPLISTSHQLEGIKEEALVGLSFFDFCPYQLQNLDMIWILGVHPPCKFTLIPSLVV
jgi:hypothetical protein